MWRIRANKNDGFKSNKAKRRQSWDFFHRNIQAIKSDVRKGNGIRLRKQWKYSKNVQSNVWAYSVKENTFWRGSLIIGRSNYNFTSERKNCYEVGKWKINTREHHPQRGP